MLHEIATMTKRCLLVWLRTPAFLTVSLVQPIVLLLLFRFVFGGAIRTESSVSYVDFLVPGMVVQSVAFAAIATAVALSRARKQGLLERFRSLPISRAAYLSGRLISDLLRLAVTAGVVLGIGFLLGFRPQCSLGAAGLITILLLVLCVGLCSISAFIGLMVKDEESAQGLTLVVMFVLTFVSSAFVPIQSMPRALRAVAERQPLTYNIDELRALTGGGVVGLSYAYSLAGSLALAAVFGAVSIWLYSRAE